MIKINVVRVIFLIIFSVLTPLTASAADTFLGDSAIYAYGSAPDTIKPINLLFIIDNSSTMGNLAAGSPYSLGLQDADPDDGTLDYTALLPWASQDESQFNIYPLSASKNPWTVYKLTGQSNMVVHISADSYTEFLSKVTCEDARRALLLGGRFSGSDGWELLNDGTCGKSSAGTTYLGNLLNYNETPPDTGETTTQIELVISAVKSAAVSVKNTIHMGLMEFGHNNKGGYLTSAVEDLSIDANRDQFFNKLDELAEYVATTPGNSRPMAESLYDARFYFDQDRTTNLTPISNTAVDPSPLQNSCDKNFIIMITNGVSVGDSDPNLCKGMPDSEGNYNTDGDYDGDGDAGDGCQANIYANGTHLLDDVAKYAFDKDLSSTFKEKQNIKFYNLVVFNTVGADDLLEKAAEQGHGMSITANNPGEVSAAIDAILNNLVNDADTAFTAPVVPTSPENRTYSGSRVFLGFFKPISGSAWYGNLKKYAIDSNSNIVDANGKIATCPDPNDNSVACSGVSNGGFKTDAQSYWSTELDGGIVEVGGVGGVLLSKTPSDRKIYSNLTGSENVDLTATANRFNTDNVLASRLKLQDDQDAYDLVRYILGYDSGDEDGDGDKNDTRKWIMGDVLHSKPLIVNYNTYTFTPANEADANVNKTMIYVGSNDGMLHAFNDATGEEKWAFIPDNLLPNLKELTSGNHAYFVDASPMVYIYDHDKDGNIGQGPEQATGDLDPIGVTDNGMDDKVVLIFGERRGGNAYYALDVTNPEKPILLWKFDNETEDANGNVMFRYLGETWSEPQMHLMKIGTEKKMVAFIGAGYDVEEDSRFGPIFSYPYPLDPQMGVGDVTSVDGIDPAIPLASRPNALGRGVYAFEVATLDSNGVPTIPEKPTKIWGFEPSDDSNTSNFGLKAAIPSDISVLDSNYDGYADRLYVGDLSGSIWRFGDPVYSSSDPSTWSGNIIFTSGASSGRKIFYRPSVAQALGYWVLTFGTGDRAHPLNTAVNDRMYMVKDKGQTTASSVDDFNLVNVTNNELQSDDTAVSEISDILNNLDTTYGWYIELDRENEDFEHGGEKVLASSLIFNKVAYYTTYMPLAVSALSTDPCTVGNMGTSRLYAVDYKTGEAVLNFASDDGLDPDDVNNDRALNAADEILRIEDRSVILGEGIPSGIVLLIPPSGDATMFIGCGGGLCSEEPPSGGTVYQIYWKEW